MMLRVRPQLVILVATVLVGVIFVSARGVGFFLQCNAIDVDQVKMNTAEFFVVNSKVASVPHEGKRYKGFPYDSAAEYLDDFPDCCRYYPDALIDGAGRHPLTWWERNVEGKCGFVGVIVKTRFADEGQIRFTDGSGRVGIVDHTLKITRDPKER
ncbi:hypothetical protein MXMO3_00928 [Maritalea myrionectae]|uniref:Uncharacterized protein n=1 Tax=Maritalea myrionectae TaxID=454601 RepID=A0A2R4MC59_9HYPH|nr:hypothetical protein [Maritalea myrionectae]AVX03459.1 hypothetical protein MXMO3_00928 [Maritalea myrionectae]